MYEIAGAGRRDSRERRMTGQQSIHDYAILRANEDLPVRRD